MVLRKQSLKYADKPLSGKDWGMGVLPASSGLSPGGKPGLASPSDDRQLEEGQENIPGPFSKYFLIYSSCRSHSVASGFLS